MIREFFPALGFSLVLTVVLETGFFLLIGKRNKRDLLLVVTVNILTNPVVVSLYWLAILYTNANPIIITMALELLAVFAEGYYYKKYGQAFPHPYFFSIVANIVSFGIGLLIQQFI